MTGYNSPASAARQCEPADSIPAGHGVTGKTLLRYGETGETFTHAPATVLELLEGLGHHGRRRVYLTGKVPGGDTAGLVRWAELPDGAGGWERRGDAYLVADQPRITYRHQLGGGVVTVQRAAPWYGEAATPALCTEAHGQLRGVLRAMFGSSAELLATPATTGRVLLWNLHQLAGKQYPVLEPAVADLVRASSTQGRFQLFASAGKEAPAGWWIYDARFAYAAVCDGAPTGPVEHDHGDEYLRGVKARYLVEFQPPTGWRHVGLLGVPRPGGDGWDWPTSRRNTRAAGALRQFWGPAWADGCEISLAAGWGWRVRILERLYWPAPATADREPLRAWAGRLVRARERVEAAAPALGVELAEALRSALRAVLLHTIGALHGRPHRITRTVADASLIPAGADTVRPLTNDPSGPWVYEQAAPAAMPALVHPEWSAHVWARQRARLADFPTRGTGLLHTPAGQLVACALDSIATNAPQPDWCDDGRTGTMRLAFEVGPVPAGAVRTMADYYRRTGER